MGHSRPKFDTNCPK